MRIRRRLSYRVAAALAAFGGAVSLIQAIGVYAVVNGLEERLVDETLAAEMQDHMERRARNPRSVPAHTTAIRAYVYPAGEAPSSLPTPLAELTPGRHQITLDGVPYRAAVADQRNERFVILYNESRLRRREQDLIVLLVAGVAAMTGLAGLAGLWLAGRIIAPVTDLVGRVANLRPEDQPPPLAAHYRWEEIRELAHDFDLYLQRLSAFIERERTFTADVSHELRTPLAVIGGAAEVLLSDPGLPSGSRDRVARIARAAREMTNTTRALLSLAREEVGGDAHASSDAAAVLREVLDGLSEILKGKDITVEVEVRAQARLPVEPATLAVAFGNLIRNAVAFTRQGKVRIVLEAGSFMVADTGSGIEPSDLPRVFERYHRRNSTGAGIGLALVKRICDRYGWSIDIESEPGRGTRACLRFVDPSGS